MAVLLNEMNSAVVFGDDPRLANAYIAAISSVNLVGMVRLLDLSPRYTTGFMSGRLSSTMKRTTKKRGTPAKQLCNATARHRQATMMPYPNSFSLLGAPSQYAMLTAMHSYALWLASVGPNPVRDSFLQMSVGNLPDSEQQIDGVDNHVHVVTGCHALVRTECRSKLLGTAGLKRFPGLHIPKDVVRDKLKDNSEHCTGVILFDFKTNLPGTTDIEGTVRTYLSRRNLWLPYAIPQGLHPDKYSKVKTMAVSVQQILETGVVTIMVLERTTESKLTQIYDWLHVGISAQERATVLAQHRQEIIETVGTVIGGDVGLPAATGRAIVECMLDDSADRLQQLAITYARPTLAEAKASYDIVSCLTADGASTNPEHMVTRVLGTYGPSVVQVGRVSRLVMGLSILKAEDPAALPVYNPPALGPLRL